MAKYYVNYKLYGTVLVEADNEKEAEELLNVSDIELLDGVHVTEGIDGDSIEVYSVEEVEE